MKNKLTTIIAIVLCFGLSRGCISDYMKGGDNKAISNYEKMIFDNSVTTAQLYPEYKEVTVKIMGAPIKTYEFRYHFMVNGTKYEGNHTFDKVPSNDITPVYYVKDDPDFNTVDPQKKLDIQKKKNTSKEPLYWGIGWGVLGLFTLLGFVKEWKEQKAQTAAVA